MRSITPFVAASALAALVPLALLAALLTGCPAKNEGDAPSKKRAPAASASCASVGQTCEFAPGKLGSCVKKDDCTIDCFVCQSQH